MTLDAQKDFLPSPFNLPEPDWLAWKKETHTPLWQAVALCCNISPTTLAFPGDEKRRFPIEREGTNNFSALLNQACNALAAQRIRAKNYCAETPEDSEIDLAEFAKWAGSIGISMPLGFPQRDTETPPPISGWPWGTYQTEMLALLAEAVERFWVRFDPNEPDTAPDSKTDVIPWLRSKGLSNNMAEAIATIIRPKNIPAKGRPKKPG